MKTLIIFLLLFLTGGVYGADNDTMTYPTTLANGAEVKDNSAAYEQAVAIGYFSISKTEEATIKQKLAAVVNGQVINQELTDNDGPEWSRELIGYYLLHTNDILTKAKFLVSDTYQQCSVFSMSAKLAKEYLNVYSNDWQGWRVLGDSYMGQQAWPQALCAYTNAIKLGDTNNYPFVGLAALQAQRLDVFKEFIPQLMADKEATNIPKQIRLGVVALLVSYSCYTKQQDLCLKALEGVGVADILKREDLRNDVKLCCIVFDGKEIEKLRQQIHDAEQSGSKTISAPAQK